MILNGAQQFFLVRTIADAYAKNFCCENPDTDGIRILANFDSPTPFTWQKKWLDFDITDKEVIVFTITDNCFGEYQSEDYDTGLHDIEKCIEECFFNAIIDEVEDRLTEFYLTKE